MDKHIQSIFIKRAETSPKSPPDTTDEKSEPTYTKTEKLLYGDLNEFGIFIYIKLFFFISKMFNYVIF